MKNNEEYTKILLSDDERVVVATVKYREAFNKYNVDITFIRFDYMKPQIVYSDVCSEEYIEIRFKEYTEYFQNNFSW